MNYQNISKVRVVGVKSCLKNLIVLLLLVVFSKSVLGLEHVVSHGENLTTIAKMYGVSVAEILVANEIENANLIHVGQKLIIPQKRMVIELDKLYGQTRAESYLAEGRKANISAEESYFLLSFIFGPSGYDGEEQIHRVKTGDTIFTLAKEYDIPEEQIRSRNALAPHEMLMPGQYIYIPSPQAKIIFPMAKEVELLARIIAAEARGESFEGQIAVGAVILNRVKDPRFPNTISDVIFEKGQFEVVSNGVYLTVVVPELSKRAAQEALRGRDPTKGALFFYNPKIAQYKEYFEQRPVAAEIGNHVFTF